MKITEDWDQKEVDFIRKKVIEHNMQELPDSLKTPNEDKSFILRNDNGEIAGGITGNMFWHHMHIEFFWVDKELRHSGHGSEPFEKDGNLCGR